MADQCEHTGPRGQCIRSQVDGSSYCSTHANEQDRIKGYRLSSPELRERFEHHAGTASLESVREEIILLRALIEDRLDTAATPAERINAFNTVRSALVDVVKCAETLSKLERQNNIVLGKESLAILNREIIEVLVGELENVPNYETIIDRVAQRIAAALANARNQE